MPIRTVLQARHVMNEPAEYPIAIGSVPRCVENVLMPHVIQIITRRHELIAGMQVEQREVLAILRDHPVGVISGPAFLLNEPTADGVEIEIADDGRDVSHLTTSIAVRITSRESRSRVTIT